MSYTISHICEVERAKGAPLCTTGKTGHNVAWLSSVKIERSHTSPWSAIKGDDFHPAVEAGDGVSSEGGLLLFQVYSQLDP
jgi:hypothetical protein